MWAFLLIISKKVDSKSLLKFAKGLNPHTSKSQGKPSSSEPPCMSGYIWLENNGSINECLIEVIYILVGLFYELFSMINMY